MKDHQYLNYRRPFYLEILTKDYKIHVRYKKTQVGYTAIQSDKAQGTNPHPSPVTSHSELLFLLWQLYYN